MHFRRQRKRKALDLGKVDLVQVSRKGCQGVPSVNMAPHRMSSTIEYLGKVQDMYVENCASKITKEKITSRTTKN